MTRILCSWIGTADIKSAETRDRGVGPIAQVVTQRPFDRVELLYNYESATVTPFLEWIEDQCEASITAHHYPLSVPNDYEGIYLAAHEVLNRTKSEIQAPVNFALHLSSGTPAMTAIWLLLGKTLFPAEFLESIRDGELRETEIPFNIATEFLPNLLEERDRQLSELADTILPDSASKFEHIIHKSDVMKRVVTRARMAATSSLPVLMEGESGTGKELFAKAIHSSSARSEHPFLAINCGAIPDTLIESELFGHEAGAFTDARKQKKGRFELAEGGTLFLDEIGEMSANAQVKVLRVLQENEIQRVGGIEPIKVDVRIIAATNRNVREEIRAGRFREDLFYRLAVSVLKLPPLRERPGDVGLLLDKLIGQVNEERENESGDQQYQSKDLSVSARNVVLRYPWPGNVRELLSTLRRAVLWSPGSSIEEEDIRESLLPVSAFSGDQILGRPLENGFSIEEVIAEVSRHYLERVDDEAPGNRSEQARLLGLGSYQTVTNWRKRVGLDNDHGGTPLA